jgi:hypothetical protein
MQVEGNTATLAGTIVRFACSVLNIAFVEDIILGGIFSD